jgi:hypothetical protein
MRGRPRTGRAGRRGSRRPTPVRGAAARRPRISGAAGCPWATATTPGRSTAPLTVTSAVPGSGSVPHDRNQATPNRAIKATCTSDSTFCTTVGRPCTPDATRRSLSAGSTGRPSIAPTTADSSPATNRSSATVTTTGTRRSVSGAALAATTVCHRRSAPGNDNFALNTPQQDRTRQRRQRLLGHDQLPIPGDPQRRHRRDRCARGATRDILVSCEIIP